jgi:hypothetical protein
MQCLGETDRREVNRKSAVLPDSPDACKHNPDTAT